MCQPWLILIDDGTDHLCVFPNMFQILIWHDLVEILPSKSLLLRKKKQRQLLRPNPRKRTKITSTSGWEPWKNVEIKFKFLLPKKINLMFWKSFKRKVVVFLQENSSLYSSVHFNLRARRLLPLFCVLPETSGNTALIAPIIFSFLTFEIVGLLAIFRYILEIEIDP